jgi:hypothetical protein
MSKRLFSSASVIAPIRKRWRGAGLQVTMMSEPEDFLTRWSRRKRATAGTVPSPAQSAEHDPAQASAGTDEQRPAAPLPAGEPATGATEAVVDLSQLPALDTITAATDIRPFFAPGVPTELTLAALRRVWTMDPSIRDFVGLAENQWDFTVPGGAPGFGTLADTEQTRRWVAQVIGNAEPETTAAAPSEPQTIVSAATASAPTTKTAAPLTESGDPDAAGRSPDALRKKPSRLLQRSSEAGAADEEGDEKVNARPRHGGALPR